MNKEFIEDLKKVQEEVPKLKKDTENPFFKSKYVPLEQVIDVVLPIVNKHNFVLIQQPTHILNEPALKTTLLHTSGEMLEDTMLLVLKSANPQEQGSAITYARRYSIMSMLGLIGDIDDDGNKATFGQAKKSKTNPIDTAIERSVEKEFI